MAYINVRQWSPDQVQSYITGLDNVMYRYMDAFLNNNVGGEKLLQMRPSTLEELGIFCIGHQEIVLEAVEHLSNFQYNLNNENLQFLALQVATTARNLYKKLEKDRDKKVLDTEALMDITRTLGKIKPLICWLDRPPFKGQQQYFEIRKKMLTLALEMAISAQRDRFALKPVDQIIQNAEILAKLCDYIIQVISDPMLLQPASLILVTLKKKESDLGFYVSPSFHGIYKVTEIKFNSPAHISGKIEEGDEVVQINYQTVVGWQHKKVLLQLHDSKPDVLLTIKKRPKHVKIYGQIYMKPYRLPSKKRSMQNRWGDTSSPRDLLSFNYYPLPMPRPLDLLPSAKKALRALAPKPDPIPEDSGGKGSSLDEGTTHEDSDNDLLTPTKLPDHELHLLLQTRRPFLQRRNTICGDQSGSFKYLGNVKFWQDRRDKSISMGFGMESVLLNTPSNLNGSMPDILKSGAAPSTNPQDKRANEDNCDITGGQRPAAVRGSAGSGNYKSVRFDVAIPTSISELDDKRTLELSAFDAIPYADEDTSEVIEEPQPPPITDSSDKQGPNDRLAEVKKEVTIHRETIKPVVAMKPKQPDPEETPPAIEPRKEQQVAPIPPPRPKKPIEMSPGSLSNPISSVAPVPPPKPMDSSPILIPSSSVPSTPKPPMAVPSPKPVIEEPTETLELVTPVKLKTLTLKKKNSILAKRRKIGVKSLQHSDIQGHLYRRTKHKSGTSYWAKGYFVLADNALYCFRTKDMLKADFLVFLSGFTVSLASEIHSKPFAFKVYHALKTLYFAAETQEALIQWMDYLRRATLKTMAGGGGGHITGLSTSNQISDIKEIFTETESSDEDSDETANAAIVHEVKPEKYHLGLGSLKKFTKSNLPGFSSHKSGVDKKSSSDLPIPSAQFRSYKKVQGYAGLSPGNHFFPPDSSLSPIASSTPLVAATTTSTTIDQYPDKNAPIPSPLTPGGSSTIGKGDASVTVKDESISHDQPLINRSVRESPSKKFQPHNYIHASNPNLVDFQDHLGSKTSPFSYKEPVGVGSLLNGGGGGGPSNGGGHNLQGFMTLMDLMLQQQAEDAKEVYNNRVFLGREKEEDSRRRKQRNDSHKSENHLKITYGERGTGDQKVDKIQSRSLPKTPDYAQSFKPDDVDIIMIRSKEGQSLRNFGYEFISEEDPQSRGGISASTLREKNRLIAATARKTDKVSPTTSWSRKKGMNWINSTERHGPEAVMLSSGGGGSFKKYSKGSSKLEPMKAERFFSFNKIVGGYDAKKSSSPGQSPSYLTGGGPGASGSMGTSSKKGNFFNISDGGVLGGTRKVANSSMAAAGALDGGDSGPGRKLSSASTASYFSKLSFAGSGKSGASTPVGASNSIRKEKKIFGSPRLHRAIFGKVQANTSSSSPGQSPIFDEVILGQGTPSWMDTRRGSKGGGGSAMPDVIGGGSSGGVQGSSTPQEYYPEMVCPPVFEPGSYSLSDPSSNTLVRRRNMLQKNAIKD